jgi:hypothetical protein
VREVRFEMACSVSMCLTPSRVRCCRQVGKGRKEEDETVEEKNSGQLLIDKVRRECRCWSPPPRAFDGLEKQP